MKTRVSCIALLLVLAGWVFAGTTGKIAGRINDHEKGEGLPGANVVVMGTNLGAATDPDGTYALMNIRPGVYQLRVTLVGYAPTVISGVKVTADQTTLINVQLTSSAVQLEDVVVQAERPMVQKDLTATMSAVSGDQIKTLPVRNFVDVLQMQAGVVGEGSTVNIRGGRSGEVAYLIDGMYVKDPVLGGLGTNISNDAIAELNLLSGTFNAEYGNALSGVVNIVTKEGARDYRGYIEALTSEFGVERYASIHENRVSATLSGPLWSEDAALFLSGERDALGSWLPYGYDENITAFGKLSARILPELKLVASGRYSQRHRQPYGHEWKYIGEQYIRIREESRHGMLTLTHNVSPTFFYDIRFSLFNQSYYSGIDKDTADYLPVGERSYLPIGNGFEFYSKADPVEVTDNRTNTTNVRGDLVWQADKWNELKFGVEVKKHALDYFNVYDPKRNYPYITAYTKNPLEGAAYIQDKIELAALVVNLGLRFDYANQLAPFRSDPLDASSLQESVPKTQWSPRLGIAHPISDRTSLHFSYGRFFQNPDYRYFYENSQYDLNVREPLFGQPDLDAERTTAYEVGLTHQFSDVLVGTFTAYYKDILGLVGTRYYLPYVDGRYIGYTLFVNESYANVRGFEVTLNLRRSKHLSGTLTYTYSVAKGSASSETENYPGTTESTLLYPLDFDKPHVLNLNMNVSWNDNEGPALFGVQPLENTSWNFTLRAGSGYPYTPGGRDVGFIERNSARQPSVYTIDLLASKDWRVGPVTLGILLEVLNLTDHKNVVRVYTDTGEPDFTTLGNYSDEYIQDPSNFGPPRRIRLGLRLRF
jgi:outer membrane receptor protein involved in Fe transport